MMTLFTLVCVFVVFVFASNNSVIPTLSGSLTTITLQDQFEVNHVLNLAGKRTIIMVGDREGLKQMPRLEEIIKEAIKSEFGVESHQILRLAYFKGMPFFVPKGWARDAVKKTYPKAAVLCDWDGTVGDKLGYKEGFAAYLLDGDGQIRSRLIGDFAQDRVKSFVQTLR